MREAFKMYKIKSMNLKKSFEVNVVRNVRKNSCTIHIGKLSHSDLI